MFRVSKRKVWVILTIFFVLVVGYLTINISGFLVGNSLNAPIKKTAIALKFMPLCDFIIFGEWYDDYGVSASTIRTRCKIDIAAKTGNFNFCKNLKDKTLSSNCIEAVYIKTQDDSVCKMLADKGDWFGEQLCLTYGSREQVVDVTTNSTLAAIHSLVDICEQYRTFNNRIGCYSGIGYKLGLYETSAFENYCLASEIDKYWLPCINWSHSGFLNMPTSVSTRALQNATTNTWLEKELCKSIRWHTFGSKRLSDDRLTQFGITDCGFNYLK